MQSRSVCILANGKSSFFLWLSNIPFVAFLYTNNELSEREAEKTIPFISTSKRIKYPGINQRRKKTYTQKSTRH